MRPKPSQPAWYLLWACAEELRPAPVSRRNQKGAQCSLETPNMQARLPAMMTKFLFRRGHETHWEPKEKVPRWLRLRWTTTRRCGRNVKQPVADAYKQILNPGISRERRPGVVPASRPRPAWPQPRRRPMVKAKANSTNVTPPSQMPSGTAVAGRLWSCAPQRHAEG